MWVSVRLCDRVSGGLCVNACQRVWVSVSGCPVGVWRFGRQSVSVSVRLRVCVSDFLSVSVSVSLSCINGAKLPSWGSVTHVEYTSAAFLEA